VKKVKSAARFIRISTNLCRNMKIKLLPYERFEITTSLTPEEVEWRLRENIEPGRILGLLTAKERFQGKIENKTFSLYHDEWYLHGFNHKMSGTIEDYKRGSRISVTIMPSYFFLLFQIIIFGTLLFNLISSISSFIFHPFNLDMLGVIGFLFILFIFFWTIIVGVFLYEVRRSKRDLNKILENNEEGS
jgi:hypothetical protein